MLQVVLGVCGGEHLTDHCQHALDLDAIDQAPDGKRGLPVLQLGQLVRMQEQTMVNQQAQDQASA